jgi:hypothetical protein
MKIVADNKQNKKEMMMFFVPVKRFERERFL